PQVFSPNARFKDHAKANRRHPATGALASILTMRPSDSNERQFRWEPVICSNLLQSGKRHE
ncbi:MAG TPA: hypothetical protein VMF30_18730, partial [Pirellulales bacterium]|nr:hypothetical protein [Pirellulales bacterium]